VEPIIADAISVITLDGGLQPIVPAGTPVPSDRIEVGALRVDRHGQRIIELPFCSGDEDKLIGVLRISAADSAGFAKGERVTVSCRLTAEKLLVAEATVAGIAKGAEFMNPLANRPLSEAEQSMLRARQHFNESAASNKGRPSVSAVENYAEAAKDAGEWRIAAEMLEAAERLDPSRNHSNSIDYCWSNAGRRDLSAAWSQIAYDRNPLATTAFNLSLARHTAGETVEFVRLCREALRREPRHLPTLNMLGRHLMDSGEPEGRSLLLRCVEIGTRLMDENEASKDDIHRLRGAAQALGLSDVVKRAAGNLARLELPLARPFDNENLVAGDSTPKIQGGA
jgi:molecular chaperone DnaK